MFDLIVLVVLVVSGLIGWARGATREIVTVLSFLVAAILTVATLGVTGAIARSMVHPDWLGTALGGLVFFVVAYVALRIGGSLIVQRVKAAEHLGTLDRAVGVGFGIIRAFVLLGAFNILLTLATPADRMPTWISGAFFYPLTNVCAKVLKAFAPEGKAMAGKIGPAVEKAVRTDDAAKDTTGRDKSDGDNGSEKGYGDAQRKRLDDQVEKSR